MLMNEVENKADLIIIHLQRKLAKNRYQGAKPSEARKLVEEIGLGSPRIGNGVSMELFPLD